MKKLLRLLCVFVLLPSLVTNVLGEMDPAPSPPDDEGSISMPSPSADSAEEIVSAQDSGESGEETVPDEAEEKDAGSDDSVMKPVTSEENGPVEVSLGFGETETLGHAAARMRLAKAATSSTQLMSEGFIASYDAPNAPGKYRFFAMMTLNGRPAYCLEPGISNGLEDGVGPFYSASMDKLSGDLQQRVKRIAFFGYGHPMTGSSSDAYIATQLLIWKEIQAPLYEHIYATFQKCGTPQKQLRACTLGQDGIDGLMSSIMNLVDNYDRVPSFADSWHGVRHYSLGWDETLSLTDSEGILSWFEEDARESHKGIHLQKEGNTLHIDIDDLYYEGHDTASGKTLTFHRKPELWNNMMAGAIVYTSGVYQKLFAETADDPVPSYQLSFKLKTADIKIQKVDEYGNAVPGQSAVYYLGWKEDPERQYHSDSGNDLRWKKNHGDRVTRDDADGQADQVGKERVYYPLLNRDGTTVRKFTSDANGVLHISGLLPAERTWWIREAETSDAYLLNPDVWSMGTGAPGTTNTASFANALRDVELELVKQDEEEPSIKINGADFKIYETGITDLSRDPMALGFDINTSRMEQPELTYWQLAEYSTLKAGDRFVLGDWQYEILKEENGVYSVQAQREELTEDTVVLSRYPFDGKEVGDVVTITVPLRHRGTSASEDDETAVYPLRIEKIEDGILTAVHTGLFENVLVKENTVPSLETVRSLCDRDPVLSGHRFLYDGIYYTVGRVYENSMIIHPARSFAVDLNDAAPAVYDLPDLRTIHAGESFSLSFHGEETSFTVRSKSEEAVVLESEAGRHTVALAQWISWDDIPQQIESQETFTVAHIKEPEYVVMDSRGNTYEVTSATASGPITYGELLNSADDIGVRGLEPGHSFTRPMEKEEILEIEPVLFESITEQEKAEGTFIRNERTYTIISVDDVSVRASTINDGKEYLLETTSALPASVSIHITMEDVTFTVTDRVEKEIDLQWNTIVPGVNSHTADGSLHLYAWADSESVETLQARDTAGKNLTAGDTFTDQSGESYTVLFKDPLHSLYVVQSRKGRYEINGDQVTPISPVSFWDYVGLEETNGKTFAVGDSFTFPYQRSMAEGDTFLIDGRAHVLVDHAYEADNGASVLAKDPFYEKTIFHALEDDAPFAADELFQKMRQNLPLEKDGVLFSAVGGSDTNDRNTVYLEGADGVRYAYVHAKVRDESERSPAEERQPQLIFQVKKEDGLSWHQLMMIRSGRKRPQQHVMLEGNLYEIVAIAEDSAELKNEADETTAILRAEDADLFAEFDSALLEMVVGDLLDYQGSSYVIQETGTGAHGSYVRLRRTSDNQSILVEESPDPDALTMEEIRFLKPETLYDLKAMFPKTASFTLSAENPHVAVSDNQYLQSDANASIVLQLRDDAGYVMQEKRIVFSHAEKEHSESALGVFQGTTGKQYVRLIDPLRHNRPLPWTTIDVCSDRELTKRAAALTSNESGVIDLNGIATGTYWYKHPISGNTESFSVTDPETKTGTLGITHLKWGRTYMACEWGLPEGYDYGSSEVCHRFTLDAQPGAQRIQASLENRLRRLKVEVLKVDQDQRETKLDNAWFTLRELDIDAREEDSSFVSRLRISDLGKDAAAGDEVIVWPAKEGGASDIYRIEAIEETQVSVSRLQGSVFSDVIPIPIRGISATAPFLYQDLVNAAGTLEKGTVVSIKEKVPREEMRRFWIRSIAYGPGTDVFGDPVSNSVIQSAVLIEEGNENAQPITVRRDTPAIAGRKIGTFLSGGLRIEKTMAVSSVPLTFSQVLEQLTDGIAIGDTVRGSIPKTAIVPSIDQVVRNDETGAETIEKDGVTWTVRAGDTGYDLTAHDVTVHLEEGMSSGAIFWMEEVDLKIWNIEETDGAITSVTVTDGSSYWYLSLDEENSLQTIGLPGVYAEVRKEDTDQPVFRGYTGIDGTIVLPSLAEGSYRIESEGNVQTVHVSRGGFEVDGLRYGVPVELCETRTPLGYLVGNACTILVPKAAYATDTVRNFKPNQRLRTRTEKVRRRRTGIE